MVASSFARALSLTLKFEGGYSDDPRDPGGATNFGITQATLANSRGHPVTKADVKSLALEEAANIYKQNYWNSICGDQLPAGVDMCLFDLAVNSGVQRTIKILQSALGFKKNGVLNAETLSGAKNTNLQILIGNISYQRLSFLQKLTTFMTFGRGWSRRVMAVEIEAKKLAAASLTVSSLTAAPEMIGAKNTNPENQINTPASGAKAQEFISPNQKEKSMFDIKNLLQSRTIWSNAIGFTAFIVSHIGLDMSGFDETKIHDSVLQIITASSFIASSIFRVLATKKLRV